MALTVYPRRKEWSGRADSPLPNSSCFARAPSQSFNSATPLRCVAYKIGVLRGLSEASSGPLENSFGREKIGRDGQIHHCRTARALHEPPHKALIRATALRCVAYKLGCFVGRQKQAPAHSKILLEEKRLVGTGRFTTAEQLVLCTSPLAKL